MDLSRSRVVLRERRVLDVLDLALRFVVENAAPYALVTALAALPAAAVSWGVAVTHGWVWGWIAALGLSLLVQVPFTVLASRLVFEPTARYRAVFAAAFRALPRVLALRLAQILIVVAGSLFFVVPGIWMATTMLIASEAITLEGASIGSAIARSVRLTSAHSSTALAGLVTLFLLEVAAIFLGDDVGRTAVSALFQFPEPLPIWNTGGGALALAGFWLIVPYVATARFFLYLDLRTRSEGWDIQTQFAAIASRAAGEERRAA